MQIKMTSMKERKNIKKTITNKRPGQSYQNQKN